MEWRFLRNDRRRVDVEGHPIPKEEYSDHEETTDYFFSWGAGYKWRMFELNGSARTDLDLYNLFTALDVRVRL